ncbi:DENN domain-containing protein 2C isoform X1 [Malaclemys terrapin pileata]|uniref:DENN domain-containing protein 2C isoform X1 n=1 Tax=Malaclemys terrapin pileata TaxID=2991368 RepID=UPI0023A8AD25|nr:DENN domain-containing protein 2C isoform X1 [Malaclemys terrapin pileata]XP_053884541.1 DENN domain-containing protein 2C isoform X1 [Malaclemys terrapin pileata]XP_053884542.1 DENN domain-containing protein 2C isoform X1 [Malaclemys terrapin pileata]XP_053884543.1 DENN domain-containing protein 2C isoform X1 [Malaclemys terrapin pileata]XP_053884544.1 DENN domain-containing protein 2C isoform X1 [Malaclemys terrapin pileata]XP_053884545.1 DENN domain-containing protein 2C isoform X1 [Mala
MHPTGTPDGGFSRCAVQTLSRSHCRNIKQKISQWEGKTRGGCSEDRQQPKDFGVQYDHGCEALPKAKPRGCGNDGKAGLANSKSLGLDFREKGRNHSQSEGDSERDGDCSTSEILRPKVRTCCPISRVEENGDWQGGLLDPEQTLPPGNFYTSRRLWKNIEAVPPDKVLAMALELKRKRESCGSTERELHAGGVEPLNVMERSFKNIYSEAEGQETRPAAIPPAKPRRTFRYLSERDQTSCGREKLLEGQCKDSPVGSSHEPEQREANRKIRGRSQRKSFEFEDIQGFRSRMAATSSQKLHEELNSSSGSRLFYTQSEDNIYEDIIYPAKENLYEDIKVLPLPLWRVPSAWKLPPPKNAFKPPKLPPKPTFLHRKTLELKAARACLHGKDTTLPVTLTEWKLFRAGEAAGRKRKNLPQLVLKIQEIFESKRGKKRVKLLAYTGKEAPPAKGETSGNESETENLPKSHHKRLLQVQLTSKRNPHYQTLERDLIEFQEQQLFELFVVVSLQKKQSETTYTPQVIQQFPSKPEHPFRQSKDTEERLKVIPKFCFPDPKAWLPTSELKSETFSFVLTGEDGSRWFGYCKKLLPEGKGKRLPEVYCMVSRLGCFNLFSKILDEVEKRREMSPALVYPFMRSVMEAPFPAPGRTITVKSFLPGAGNEVIELCRPLDSRLEHVDFERLFKCLSVCHLIQVCASLLLERRVIFVADNLSTLSKCGHAVVATLYPFTWQHTYIPVLPASMIDIVCSPTPFLIGILSCSLPQLQDLPIEEVLIVDLCADSFLQQISDEDEILPHKLQAALVQILEERNEILSQEQIYAQGDVTLNSLVSEAFVQFFVEIVGHYSLHMNVTEKGERVFQREPFRKSHTSRNVRHFLDLFMETQMFAGFIQDRELRKSGVKGLFEVRALEYLETIPETEPSGMNKILRSLGSKMKFLQRK